MTQSTGRHIGPYVLEDKLGSGGMGVVYRATDTVLDRPVAIKMMHPAERLGEGVNIEEVQARFLREAKAAARIQSRHVASVLQFGHDVDEAGDPIAYIVMEFLKGRPLNKVISKGGPMAPARAVHIGVQIAKGMAAAHDLGIIHRDLKPANVMLIEEEGDADFVKILDFGVAKLTHDQQTHGLTQAGALLGTLAFMAPEQISGKDVDARTDIYSLGIILYRMFTGVTVWDADSLSDIVRHQLGSRPPSMAERLTNPLFSAAHDEVVLRCLEKDPALRFQTMRELAAALVAAEQAPRTSSAVAALPAMDTMGTMGTMGAPTAMDAAPAEALEPTRTSPATGPTGAGRGWTDGLAGLTATTMVATDDDGVFANGADDRRDAPTVAATQATTLSVAAPPAVPVRPDGRTPSTTATTTSTSAGPLRVVFGLAASAILIGVVIAIVAGRQTAPAPQPSPTSPPMQTTTATTAPTPPVSVSVTTTPPALAPTPNAPPTPPPPVAAPAPSVATPPLEPTATPPPPPPAPAPAPPLTRPPRSTKPMPPVPSPTPAPVPSPAPTTGFKRVHTRGATP